VKVDLAVLTPAYLDYTFVGLEALPGPGEERFAGDMLRSPGGGAITAIGAHRLGLRTALVAPLGDDLAGNFVRRSLREEGVIVGDARGSRTPTTVVMPVDGERSMVTVDPGIRARAADLEPLSPRAVAATLEQIDVVPGDVCAFITCGDDDARAFAGRLPRVTRRPRALIVNRREAGVLTGAASPAEAVERLGEVAEIAAVTLGGDGAMAVVDGRCVEVKGSSAAPVVDSTGAGDLFAAALAWADLAGADPEVSLAWANLYAGLSIGSHTGAGGAMPRERLLDEGERRGLPPLPDGVTA
jgi:sugar/nucleoside kinase (ribokinase family)